MTQSDASRKNERLGNDIVAAEAKVARLKDGLRRLEELAQAWVKVDTYDGLDMEPRRTAHARAQMVLEQARALLAEDVAGALAILRRAADEIPDEAVRETRCSRCSE